VAQRAKRPCTVYLRIHASDVSGPESHSQDRTRSVHGADGRFLWAGGTLGAAIPADRRSTAGPDPEGIDRRPFPSPSTNSRADAGAGSVPAASLLGQRPAFLAVHGAISPRM
jgi:hypothetical protein